MSGYLLYQRGPAGLRLLTLAWPIVLAAALLLALSGCGGGGEGEGEGTGAGYAVYGITSGGDIYSVDIATGELSFLVASNLPSVVALAYDSSTSTVFAAQGDGDACPGGGCLYSLDLTTGAYSALNAEGAGVIADLTVRPNDGALFAISTAPECGYGIYSVSKANGALTFRELLCLGTPFAIAHDGAGAVYASEVSRGAHLASVTITGNSSGGDSVAALLSFSKDYPGEASVLQALAPHPTQPALLGVASILVGQVTLPITLGSVDICTGDVTYIGLLLDGEQPTPLNDIVVVHDGPLPTPAACPPQN